MIDTHPHIISVKCDNPRLLASKFIQKDFVMNVHFGPDPDSLQLEITNRDQFFSLMPSLVVQNKINILEITLPDDNLQAVFDYLIGK